MRKLFLSLVFSLTLFTGFAKADTYGIVFSEARDLIRFYIKDVNTSRQNYTDAQINAIMNQVNRDVCTLSELIVKSYSFELEINTTGYALPDDTYKILRVTLNDKELEEKTLAGLDGEFSGSDWQTATGTPQDYYQDPANQTYIYFYPFPASSSSTGTVDMNYIAVPNTMSNDTDGFFNDGYRFRGYTDLIVWGSVAQIYILEGRADKAQVYIDLYNTRLASLVSQKGEIPNYFPGFSGTHK